MKIAIITSHTSELETLAELTWDKNKKLYCEKHGYGGHVIDNIIPSNISDNYQYDALGYLPKSYRGVVYTKVKGIKDILSNYDWVMWCDTDTLITNFNIRIESFLDNQYHFVIAKVFNGVNAGVLCVRNSELGKKYIEDMFNYRSYFLHEQDFIIKTADIYKNTIKYVPQKTFNSFCFSDGLHTDAPSTKDAFGLEGQWTPGDFIMHWPGTNTEQRLSLAKKYLNKVII